LAAEDDSQGDEEGKCREDEDCSVEPEDADFDAEVFFHGAEEDVQVAVFAVVALFHFGFGDEVGDFLIHVDLLSGEAGSKFREANGLEWLSVDDVVDAAKGRAELARCGGFQTRKQSEGVLEIFEAFVLSRRRLSLPSQLVDHRLDFFLAAGERIEFGLGKDEGLVGPAGGHDFTDERNLQVAACRHGAFGMEVYPLLNRMDEVEVAVHFFILDESAAKDDLGNENDWNNQDASLALSNECGNDEPDRGTVGGCEEHRGEDDPKSIAQREQGISNESKEGALNDGEEAEGENFREDVVADVDIEISLAHQHGAVVDDIVHAVREA